MTTFTSEIDQQAENRAIVRRFFEELGSGNLDIIDELVSDHYEQHSIMGVPPGKEGVRTFFEKFSQAFPDMAFQIIDTAAEGDRVFLRGRMTGTWKNEYLGQKPTGRSFDVVEFDEFRIAYGKLAEHWDAVDTGSFARQIGFRAQSD